MWLINVYIIYIIYNYIHIYIYVYTYIYMFHWVYQKLPVMEKSPWCPPSRFPWRPIHFSTPRESIMKKSHEMAPKNLHEIPGNPPWIICKSSIFMCGFNVILCVNRPFDVWIIHFSQRQMMRFLFQRCVGAQTLYLQTLLLLGLHSRSAGSWENHLLDLPEAGMWTDVNWCGWPHCDIGAWWFIKKPMGTHPKGAGSMT